MPPVIVVIAHGRLRADLDEEAAALLNDVQEASRRDEGCLGYGYYSNVADRRRFVAVEEWRDAEALKAHLTQPHVARLSAALPELLDGAPEIQAHEVASSGPLPRPG
jgi:quinol monooxygenase YgiN